jgi:DnaD/phage-associated family protein
MKNSYWIKLYYELREDIKVYRLSDSAFRRFILLMLLAGENEKRDGTLPDIDDISFLLRIDVDKLQSDLYELEQAGIVEMRSGVPFLVNFEKRQSPKSGAERIAAYRERKKKREYYNEETPPKRSGNDDVTNRYTDTDTDKITDTEQTVVVAAYENTFGPMASRDAYEILQDDLATYGQSAVIEALDIARRRKARSYKYVEGILRNRKTESSAPSPNGTALLEKIMTAVSKYGRPNGRKAKATFSDEEWATVRAMGGWANLCAMTPDKIQISYYSARKAANYAH